MTTIVSVPVVRLPVGQHPSTKIIPPNPRIYTRTWGQSALRVSAICITASNPTLLPPTPKTRKNKAPETNPSQKEEPTAKRAENQKRSGRNSARGFHAHSRSPSACRLLPAWRDNSLSVRESLFERSRAGFLAASLSKHDTRLSSRLPAMPAHVVPCFALCVGFFFNSVQLLSLRA